MKSHLKDAHARPAPRSIETRKKAFLLRLTNAAFLLWSTFHVSQELYWAMQKVAWTRAQRPEGVSRRDSHNLGTTLLPSDSVLVESVGTFSVFLILLRIHKEFENIQGRHLTENYNKSTFLLQN